MADDVPGDALVSDLAGDDVTTVDAFLCDLGFEPADEEEISLFLTWLYPLAPSSEHDMALILSGSEYSELDPEKVYVLWHLLQDAIGDADLYWAGSNTGGTKGGDSIGYIGWRKTDPSKLYVMERLPTSSGDVQYVPILAEIDLAQIIAEQGYLTQASLTPLEELLQETNSLLSQANLDYDLIYNRLGLLLTELTSVYNRLGLMENDLGSLLDVTKDMYSAVRGDTSGSIYSFLKRVDSNISYMRNTQLPEYLGFSRSWSFDEASNSIKSTVAKSLGVAELLDTNFKDLDSLLLKNFGSSFSFPWGSTLWAAPFYMESLPAGSGLMEVLSAIGATLYLGFNQYGERYLDSSGYVSCNPYLTLMSLLGESFIGFDHNMERLLIGGFEGHYSDPGFRTLTFDGKLNKKTSVAYYYDVLHAMVGIGSDIQNPLSQLQAVLASDADLELHRNTQENIDSVTDNFTGSGDGAVSGGDISDASGLTSGIGNAFGGNQVSTGDAFRTATDLGNFDFLSEECAAALDSVAYPVAVVLDADDDSWLDGYAVDEDGFYSVADLSGWSFLDYLGKEG